MVMLPRPKTFLLWLLSPYVCLCSLRRDDDLIRHRHVSHSHLLAAHPRDANTLLKTSKKYEQRRASDSCRGLLPWTCICQPEVVDDARSGGVNALKVDSISCVSVQTPETADILTTLSTFANVQSASFIGNQFKELPERFSGPGQHKKLLYLNLTSNHIHHLHHDSLIGVPSLQSLDLSNNQLHLRHEHGDSSFLRPVRYLRRLLLKRAFKRHSENENAQLHSLENGLRHAHLRDLQFLDLSHNEFSQFPPKLICWIPAITHLILAHNRFRTLRFEERCQFYDLKVVDLRANRLVYFTYPFSKNAARLPPMSMQVNGNPLDCSSRTCASWHSMMWFRSTAIIRDKERVRCHSSSEDDHREKFSDFMYYAPLDSHLNCAPFGNVTSAGTSKAHPSEDESTRGKIEDEHDFQVTTAYGLGNGTVATNNTASIGSISLSLGYVAVLCVGYVVF